MKQRINNQKVINWHAPKKVGALYASYITKRKHGFESLFKKQVDVAETDFCVYCKGWSCYDDESVVRCSILSSLNDDIFELADGTEEFVDRDDSLCEVNRKNIERKFAFSNPILLPLEMVEEANEALFDKQKGPRRIQEADLAGHFQNLKTAEQQNPSILEFDPRDALRIKNVLCPDQEFPATRERPSMSENFDATFVALFLGYSIRSLSQFKAISGDAPKDFPSLAEYLFCHYPIPQWLKAVWKNPKISSSGDLNQAVKWAYWFICMGQGGSLRKLASLMGGRISGKLVRFLYEAPSHLHPERACAWAEAMRISGNRRVADWISQNRGYGIDPSFVPESEYAIRFRKFWQQTVKWFARFERELSDEAAAELLEWGSVRFSQDSTRNIFFSWAGRTPASTQGVASRDLQKFFRELGGTTNFQWHPVGVTGSLETAAYAGAKTDAWTFDELTESSALWEEGVAMGHCVASYGGTCAEHISVVVSVRRNGERVLTIELDGRTKAVLQVKGRFNREPTAAESAVVAQWHREVVRGQKREVLALAA